MEGAAVEIDIQGRVSSIYGGGGVRWRLGGRSYYKNADSHTDTFVYNRIVLGLSGRWTVPY